MTTRATQHLLNAALAIIPLVGVLFTLFGPRGTNRDLMEVYPLITKILFGITLITAGAVASERKRIAAIQGDENRKKAERKLVRQVAMIYSALIFSIPAGWIIGSQF